MRKLMSHAFADSALREQEPLILSYCDLLIKRLHDQLEGPTKGEVDIVRWVNFTTFDLIGDLTFGESFSALQKGEYHFWVASIFRGMKFTVYAMAARAFPPMESLMGILMLLFPSLSKGRFEHRMYSREKALRRLQQQTDRRDFMR
jgi:hypothetical protein